MIKTFIPIMKTEFDQLNHAKMHEDMEHDNIQMKFIDHVFDFCVGEGVPKMSYEDDIKCSNRLLQMIADNLPHELTLVTKHDQGKISLKF